VGGDVAARLALVDDEAARRIAQHLAGLIGADRRLELDADRLGWPMNTGTRTQVATSLIFGSRIFLVSATSFHSSRVKPSSMNTSICGITLKAILFGNFFGSIGSVT